MRDQERQGHHCNIKYYDVFILKHDSQGMYKLLNRRDWPYARTKPLRADLYSKLRAANAFNGLKEGKE